MGFFARVYYCSISNCGSCWCVWAEPHFGNVACDGNTASYYSCVVLGVILLLHCLFCGHTHTQGDIVPLLLPSIGAEKD